jgi:uncharacterized repeat protein (TIGR01451 family)
VGGAEIGVHVTVIIGDNIFYIITISNDGPDAAKNILLTDTPDYAFSLVTASEGCKEENRRLNCLYPELIPGSEIVIVLVIQPHDGPGTLTNTVEITSDMYDLVPENNVDIESTVVRMEQVFNLHIPLVIKK